MASDLVTSEDRLSTATEQGWVKLMKVLRVPLPKPLRTTATLYRRIGISALVAATLAGVSTHSIASILERDLRVVGDGLITLDSVTQLEWLDIAATLGLSYRQAATSEFGLLYGFRHATTSETRGLFTALGIFSLNGAFLMENYAGGSRMLQMLGPGVDSGNFLSVEGFHDLDVFSPTEARTAGVDVPPPFVGAGARAFIDVFPGSLKDYRHQSIGNFMVRANVGVPEPTAIVLVGFGLLSLALSHGRRRRLLQEEAAPDR